jgi:predicted amidohydrolase YtcJ
MSKLKSKILVKGWPWLVVLAAASLFSCAHKGPEADIVFVNGDIHTMEASTPKASAMALKGETILAVCVTDEQAKVHIGPSTKVVDLKGGWAVPGLIDGHVHFNQAGALILDANLMTVSDETGLRREVSRVAAVLEDGEWITGGLYGAYEQWALGNSGVKGGGKKAPWRPNRGMIDELTPANPCFLCRFDYGEWLANTAALAAAGLDRAPLDGLEVGKDGEPTGIIFSGTPAFKKMRETQKPKSRARLLDENRAALRALREAGIVEVHDIERPDQTDRFVELEERGELTCRVWLRPDLSRGAELGQAGLTMGLHQKTKQKSSWLRYGALKGYIDGIMGTHGALFFEPYDDEPGNYGHWRPHTSDDPENKIRNMEKMYGLIKTGLDHGFVPNVHAIGDRGVAEMLDLYERLSRELGRDLEGFRVIHAQVIRPGDFPRFKALNVIAEVNP